MNKAMRLFYIWAIVVCVTAFNISSTYADENKIITGAEIKQMLSKEIYLAGWTNRGSKFIEVYFPDGSVEFVGYVRGGKVAETDKGKWRVEGDEICVIFGSEYCAKWRRDGEKIDWVETSGHSAGYYYVLGE